MALGLKGYVQRTIKETAKGYSGPRKERLKGALTDAARGTDTGWWSDLIYTSDVLKLARRYRADVRAAVERYTDETGQGLHSFTHGGTDSFTFGEIVLATYAERGAADRDDRVADALSYGIRLAVELLTFEVASDWGIDL